MNNYIDNSLLYNYDILPPEDVVSKVNPFSKNIKFILIGLAMWIIKLNFMKLNYLLPLAGILLLTSGFRALKKENRWFLSCFVISVFLLLEFSATLIINTTIFHQKIYQSPLMMGLSVISTILSFLLFFCFGRGIRELQESANLPKGAGGTVTLIIWYAVLYALALTGYSGIFIGIIMLVAFLGILISLYGVSKELDEAGYMLSPPATTIPNWVICLLVCSAIIAGGLCGYIFGGKYDMKWQAVTDELSTHQHIKEQLLSLGFPDAVLNDLSPADLLECNDAVEIQVKEALHPANKGREVISTQNLSGRKTYIHSTVYDQKELYITSVAVKLPYERETWKIFHHFTWRTTPAFHGTECIRIIPAYNILGWSNGGNLSGRILYDDGETYTAPFNSLESQLYTADNMFFGPSTSDDIYATFSLPDTGTNHRGYVCYTAVANQPGWILSSWINYTHRLDFFQYPNRTAMDDNLKGMLEHSDAFISVQDAIQFYPNN